MSETNEDTRALIRVDAEVPSDDEIRMFYEVPDSLAMLLWRDKSTTFCEALGDLLAEARDLRAGWKCEGCGTTDASRRYDNGEACDECVHRAFGESG